MIFIYGTYVCIKGYLLAFFSFFFKILIFRTVIWVGVVVKGQKMVQNNKKFCLSHYVSQEPYII